MKDFLIVWQDWDPFADPADEDHQEPAQAAECKAEQISHTVARKSAFCKALVTPVLTTRHPSNSAAVPMGWSSEHGRDEMRDQETILRLKAGKAGAANLLFVSMLA